jgi:hypothetical protein
MAGSVFSLGSPITLKGLSSPVMTVLYVDNIAGTVTTPSGTFAQENVQLAGIQPSISVSAPSGLRVASDPFMPGQF